MRDTGDLVGYGGLHTPTDKPHVERTFESIAPLFLQYAIGYVGRGVEHRARDVESQSEQLLTIAQMQELLEDWIAVEWQNRSHDGLHDPLHPTIMLPVRVTNGCSEVCA